MVSFWQERGYPAVVSGDGDVVVDVELVRRLLAAQFPRWASLPLSAVPVSGRCDLGAGARWGHGRVAARPDDPFFDDPARVTAALRHLDELVADL